MRRKKIAFFASESGNLGNLMHCEGLKYILYQIFPKKEYAYHYIMQDKDVYSYDILRSDYDYIIMSGSPRLGLEFYKRYGHGLDIRELFARNKKAIKIACGIGALFPEQYRTKDVYKDERFGSKLREFYGDFDLIMTRSRFACDIFEAGGIKAYCFPCPSLFIFKQYRDVKLKKDRRLPLIVFGHTEFVSQSLTTEEQKERIVKTQQDAVSELPQFRTGVVGWEDWLMANHLLKLGRRKSGFEKVRKIMKFNSLLDAFEAMRQAKFVISARLHFAIPASLLGVPSYLIPFDSRKHCTEFFNVKVIYKFEDVKPYKFEEIDIDGWEKKYIKLLEKVKR